MNLGGKCIQIADTADSLFISSRRFLSFPSIYGNFKVLSSEILKIQMIIPAL